MTEHFLKDRVALHCGDCREVLAQLGENSLDACVTDPPYHLTSIVKRFGNATLEQEIFAQDNPARQYGALCRGFMSKLWDGGDIAFRPETWAAVYRVLKPGAHLLAFGGTRTYHRMACAIEDAGFEIRDCVQWLYGSGFPKSHDVSKGIDRAAGAERKVVGKIVSPFKADNAERDRVAYGDYSTGINGDGYRTNTVTAPATDAARQWEGWGTALKPACELIILARKPLSEGTVAANVLRWGTGAINVDGCRVAGEVPSVPQPTLKPGNKVEHGLGSSNGRNGAMSSAPLGRWPANLIHDGSAEVVAAFPEAGGQQGSVTGLEPSSKTNGVYGQFYGRPATEPRGDTGSAARFFYTAKADADDRLGSKHPTIKPLDLMQYLVRLITPKGGTIIDPFAGTGTTGEAAWREGMSAVLIEREAEYAADIRRRMALALAGPDERARESIKAKNLPRDDGPLFASREPWDEMWSRPFDYSKLGNGP